MTVLVHKMERTGPLRIVTKFANVRTVAAVVGQWNSSTLGNDGNNLRTTQK